MQEPAGTRPEPVLIGGARWIELAKFSDPRGALTPIEGGRHVPLTIRRVFYFYDVPVGERRGAHAHRRQHQIIACLAGGFDVVLDDGRDRQTVRLFQPWRVLYAPPLVWMEQVNFDGGTVGLALASEVFDEADYIRDYSEFLEVAKQR
jgi:dTDP-4-dehydrorhamnose 3,5-epimerase-like enzyme